MIIIVKKKLVLDLLDQSCGNNDYEEEGIVMSVGEGKNRAHLKKAA